MKTDKNILIAFILNLSLSIIEIIGGFFTGSVAIISDAVHDAGDALSIGISYFLEKKSKKKPDNNYTYGYARYSILGAFITTSILIVGSCLVIYESINRLFSPVEINYNNMIIFALIGVVVNFLAVYFTKDGDSLNQKSVNLHMLEDVLGWVVVLIGSILMKYTDIVIIDSIMSIGVSLFILIHAIKGLNGVLDLFLEKTPTNISIEELREYLLGIKEVRDVHHIHVWSIDGNNNYATLHVVTNTKKSKELKNDIKEELEEHGISHVTIEIESEKDGCDNLDCHPIITRSNHHHH